MTGDWMAEDRSIAGPAAQGSNTEAFKPCSTIQLSLPYLGEVYKIYGLVSEFRIRIRMDPINFGQPDPDK